MSGKPRSVKEADIGTGQNIACQTSSQKSRVKIKPPSKYPNRNPTELSLGETLDTSGKIMRFLPKGKTPALLNLSFA